MTNLARTILVAHLAMGVSACASVSGPPLYQATKSGDVSAIANAITSGHPVDQAIDVQGRTPLMNAVSWGRWEAVRFLIARGAKVNAQDRRGFTPLREAVEYCRPDVARILLDAGARLDIADVTGATPLSATASIRSKWPDLSCGRELEGLFKLPLADPAPRDSVVRSEVARPLIAKFHPAFSLPAAQNDYAVVIGVENYTDLPSATGAQQDSNAVRRYLIALGIPERNIVSLEGGRATKNGFDKTFDAWLPNNTNENSRVFIYFSGHGAPDPATGDAYLVPADGDPQYLTQTGYSLRRLYAALGRCRAKQIVVILDSCFSGTGGRSLIAKGTRPLVGTVAIHPNQSNGTERLHILSAADSSQISGVDEASGHGLFTRYLLEGLDGAAKDSLGRITLQSLYTYIKPAVADSARRANREQTPQLLGQAASTVLLRDK